VGLRATKEKNGEEAGHLNKRDRKKEKAIDERKEKCRVVEYRWEGQSDRSHATRSHATRMKKALAG
jgi:hypothetical protein